MAAVDYFLKLDGIEGESADHKHKNEIQLESFSFGNVQQGAHGAGGGGGADKAQFQDLHFTMSVNKASPKLFVSCANGTHIAKAILIARKAGKDQQEYLKITLTDVLVSSYQQNGAASGHILPMDSVSLNYAKIEIEYKPQNEKGALGGPVSAGYDIKSQKTI